MGRLIKEWWSVTGKSVMRAYRTRRPDGVRIRIERPDGTVLYDTDDCHDMGNAVDSAEAYASTHRGDL